MKKIFLFLALSLVLYSCKENQVVDDFEQEYIEFESMTNPNFFDNPDFVEIKLSYREAREKSIEIIKNFEGFSSKRYKCPAGKITLGYGLTGKYIKGRSSITKKDAEQELKYIYDELYDEIKVMLGDTKLKESQMAALVSLGFNLGTTRLSETTLINNLKNGKNTPEEFKKFVYARNSNGVKVKLNGLEKRRLEEYKLFNY